MHRCEVTETMTIAEELNRGADPVAYWWGLWAPGRLDRVLEELAE